MREKMGTSVLLITHDLGVIAEMAERVAVMYAGLIVEQAACGELFDQPLHPYTQGLIGSIPILGKLKERLDVIPGNVPNLIDPPVGCRFAPRCPARDQIRVEGLHRGGADAAGSRAGPPRALFPVRKHGEPPGAAQGPLIPHAESLMAQNSSTDETLVRVQNLKKYFPVRAGVMQRVVAQVQAVDDVSFEIRKGETLGLVGESGCGKTTVGRTMLRLIEPTAGSAIYNGRDIFKLKSNEVKAIRRDMQIIFQDPYASLDPRVPIGESVMEGLHIHHVGTPAERVEIMMETLKKVGLETYHARRFPHEFSGGQTAADRHRPRPGAATEVHRLR